MENVNLDPYLKEALLSQQNRTAIAILLFDAGRTDLMPTQLEDIFFHAQSIIDKYCIAEQSAEEILEQTKAQQPGIDNWLNHRNEE